MHLLVLDNHDSFTFNLVQQLAQLTGVAPSVVAHDEPWPEALARTLDAIVISPGPGRPERTADLGLSRRALELDLPVLGVCLGHQAIAHAAGARIVHAPEPRHGRLSPLRHADHPLFAGIPQGAEVVRYHSLAVAEPLPAELEPLAWSDDGVLMALGHRARPQWGVQFHPESICTAAGARLLANFLALARARQRGPRRAISRPSRPRPAPPAAPTWRVEARRLVGAIDGEAWFVAELAAQPSGFWLDGAAGTEPGRFSFLGDARGPHAHVVRYQLAGERLTIEQAGVTTTRREPLFPYLERILAERRVAAPELPFDLVGGLVGYLGYELGAECRVARPRPMAAAADLAAEPDAAFVFADRLIAIDHAADATYVVAVAPPGDEGAARAWCDETAARLARLPLAPPLEVATNAASALTPARDRAGYLADVDACLAELRDGESYEICLTTQHEARVDVDPARLMRILRQVNPAPYAAYLRFGEVAIVSSSPERFLRIDRERAVTSRPIKGTRPRGASAALDRALRDELAGSEKDRAENLMIVDLVRSDLGGVCEIGSVAVPAMMEVESFATVHQLVSTVRGALRPGVSALECVRAAFPPGSMTGAPKRRTMEILARLERAPRGAYAGALGFFGLGGGADLAVVIRTAVVTPGRVRVGAGGGVVAQSEPAAELAEVELKAAALGRALARCGGRGVVAPQLAAPELDRAS